MDKGKYPFYRGQEVFFTNNRGRKLYGIIHDDFMLIGTLNTIFVSLEDECEDSYVVSAFNCEPI